MLESTGDTQQPAPFVRPNANLGCGMYAGFAVVSIWVLGCVIVSQFSGWFSEQNALIQDTPFGPTAWPTIVAITLALVALPTVPLSIWTPTPRYRAVYRSWAVALGPALLFGIVRGASHNATQLVAVAQTVIALAAWLVLRRFGERQPQQQSGSWLALLFLPILVVPWMLMGALGSALDVVLALAQGLSFGMLASTLIARWLAPALLETSQGSGWDVALGGFASGVLLAILVCGFGFDGNQLLLLFALPPLGYAAFTLERQARKHGRSARGAITLLVGGTTAAALLFVDPAELTVLLGFVEQPAYALAAAGLASFMAWVVSTALFFLRDRDLDQTPVAVRWATVGVLTLGALVVYTFAGRPGLYGERLFVVMRDQADLRAIAANPDREGRLVATYQTLTDHATQTQTSIRADLDRWGIDYTPYYLVNGLEVEGGPFVRAYLESRANVDRVLLSPQLRPLPDPLPVDGGEQTSAPDPVWSVELIGADRVWDELGVTGEGVVVGQSDSGVQGDHPALRDGYRGRGGTDDGNWLDPWNGTRTPTDIGGHGTHTLGSAVGRGGVGVAPGAEWFGCVNLARNLGNPPYYLDCMQFMLAPYREGGDPLRDGDPRQAADVINNSWGCPELEGCDPAALLPATRALRTAGIFVVASAGNSGPLCGSVSDPLAIYDEAFSVGAINADGDLTSFSSRGVVEVDGSQRPKPDILAPGEDVVSSLPESTYGPNSGTSMAGPHVVGVVALMWSAQPRLVGDIDTTERILRETAQPYDGTTIECVETDGSTQTVPVTYGVVDAFAAVQAAQALEQ